MEEITNNDETIQNAPPEPKHPLDDYWQRLDWLRSLITDPAGSYYLVPKTQTEYLKDYLRQIARTKAFLEHAGNPQEKYPVIHIAGTSGKGSVATMIGAILRQAGLKTGVHTSPYLQVPNEKLLINDVMISPQAFVELVNEFKQILVSFYKKTGEMLRYQEAWACLMYMYFAKCNVNWAVVETALGGRYDPTNVVDSKLAIITNIAMEHTPQLGTSLAEIAKHKAGIIKRDQPVITSETNPKTLDIFVKEATKNNAKLYKMERDFSYKIHKSDHTGITMDIRTPFKTYEKVNITRPGTFNAVNAAVAVKAAEVLAKKYDVPVSEKNIRTALESWKMPGRMETVQHQPQVILDSAHNPQKMRALISSLKTGPHKAVTVITGMLAFKDVNAILAELIPAASRIIATHVKVLGKPSLPASELAGVINRINPSLEVTCCNDVEDAIKTAVSKAKPDELVLITGSMYLIGEAREYWFPSEKMLLEIKGD